MLYNQIIGSDTYTVLSEYEYYKSSEVSYQSEKMMEDELIADLCSQGYEYLTLCDEQALIDNLRNQLETLNKTRFSDSEWHRFFTTSLCKKNLSVIEKTEMIQDVNTAQDFEKDDGSHQNVILIDKKNIHNNRLQVINQYEVDTGIRKNRYDVTILVNGLPTVHVELKRRGVSIREAFNQIKRYQNDSFWSGSGLYEYIQLFVISNGTETKYYSNTTRYYHSDDSPSHKRSRSDSFQFTSYWTTAKNDVLSDIKDFTRTFFEKSTLLNILTKYCVFTTERKLLVMRPYQIAATERILQQINIAYNNKFFGSVDAGGYIWHTTGSGKTLTSFKTAQLASKIDYIHKVIFVVDRKDLDYQTIREYERFEKGCVDGNKSTNVLTQQLENKDKNGFYRESKIVVTTIQKLSRFVKDHSKHYIYDKHIVFIFDECHRSQFGEMHQAIVSKFKKYYLFGFTGTPIMEVNSSSNNVLLKTTDQAFGKELHTYTIVNAISDKNVLPFRIEYVNTMREKDSIRDSVVSAIDVRSAIESPVRIHNNVEYILNNFDRLTKRDKSYSYNNQHNRGFNSIFAVDSIHMAKLYYSEFVRQLKDIDNPINVALIYTYTANEDVLSDGVDSEALDPSMLDQSSRDFLENAIKDYCHKFGMHNLDTSSSGFDSYYKNVSQRMKNKEIDILIVVNMFLTGFDAPTLNTLWVDKNLRQHGLLQAFSRTNRILNDVKTHGNIVCFRDLESETKSAVALFGGNRAPGVIMMRTFEDLFQGYVDSEGNKVPGYTDMVQDLKTNYPCDSNLHLVEENEKASFVKSFSKIIRLNNILNSFAEFDGHRLLTDREYNNYLSYYCDLKDEMVGQKKGLVADIQNDIEFETELIEYTEVNVDYILATIEEMSQQDSVKNIRDIVEVVDQIMSTCPNLRSKRELIREFINSFNLAEAGYCAEVFAQFVQKKMEMDLVKIISSVNLNPANTRKLIDDSFSSGHLIDSGEQFDRIVKVSLFFSDSPNERIEKLQIAREKLTEFFEKYNGIYISALDC